MQGGFAIITARIQQRVPQLGLSCGTRFALGPALRWDPLCVGTRFALGRALCCGAVLRFVIYHVVSHFVTYRVVSPGEARVDYSSFWATSSRMPETMFRNSRVQTPRATVLGFLPL